MTDRETQTNKMINSGGPLPECTRCEAMFRSVELFEAHRRLCFGGQVRNQLFNQLLNQFFNQLINQLGCDASTDQSRKRCNIDGYVLY